MRNRVRSVSYGQVRQNSDRDPAAPLRREAAWKKIQGDVFRKPRNPLMLSMLVGAGAQVGGTIAATITYSVYDSYFNQGAILHVITGIFPWFSFANGYVSSRFYKFFNGSKWGCMDFCSMFFLPTLASASLIVIDGCEWIETEYQSTHVAEALLISVYWYAIHLPLCFTGSYCGFT